ncbi:4-hydroxy-tetrahydrodipicolinate reductase [Tissierella sp. MSJ-40]|uniref:4-hydroxy-tetrahydrodipicolinate reductase n=1 Tax=Tissierella simiarum TaxID=2841534 RepID=A0ABS6E9I8_9FIRM|nr:4-hydroxy-tetrahydrodipicolinate reductase [Tissierella simiarum]MBU5439060.1 4-hydroxy-tetrahydrodipicolinate reductase [Tissierella simiarum]
MIKAAINGYLGHMGQVIEKLILENDNIELVAGIDKNISNYKGELEVYENVFELENKCDVIIDFSHPSSLESLVKYCTSNKTPLVIGTTGYGEKEIDLLNEGSKEIPIFYTANMSLGVNLLLDLVSKAAILLKDDFDIEIIEKHHNKKIDAPSGTAYLIADTINKELENSMDYVFDRHLSHKKRSNNEIGIHSIRGGTIVGEHSVIFSGLDEVIEIKHSAGSKQIFGQGALRAVDFIIGKEPGLYNMRNLIK